MRNWVETEWSACPLHDARHEKRLAPWCARLRENPVPRLPSACHGWAETVAASRVLDNPALGAQELLSGPKRAPLDRSRAQAVVVRGQEPTCLNDGPTPQKPGMGPVTGKRREASRLHPSVAFTPARVNFGGLGATWWQRPAQPVGQERNRQPREETERARWLEGEQLACAGQRRGPDTRVVNVADRAGDLHEWLLEAMRRVPGDRAEVSSRAQCARRLATGPAPRSVWEGMHKARAVGRITVELARQPARPPRPVPLSVAGTRVTFQGARRPGGRLPPVAVVAVSGKESRPPDGEAPSAWLLLTSLPVTDVPRACPVVQWSRCRWEIALVVRGLTQGGQIEP